MTNEFTGYIIREDYDLNNLKEYGFDKTSPKDINPWWQHPFNITWDIIGRWDCELLVNKNDRKLLMKHDDGCNMDRLNDTIEKMKQDGVFVDN
jgi:hypothetical protein